MNKNFHEICIKVRQVIAIFKKKISWILTPMKISLPSFSITARPNWAILTSFDSE